MNARSLIQVLWFAFAVDPYGKVCAGGIGAGNYPAFACIGS